MVPAAWYLRTRVLTSLHTNPPVGVLVVVVLVAIFVLAHTCGTRVVVRQLVGGPLAQRQVHGGQRPQRLDLAVDQVEQRALQDGVGRSGIAVVPARTGAGARWCWVSVWCGGLQRDGSASRPAQMGCRPDPAGWGSGVRGLYGIERRWTCMWPWEIPHVIFECL